MLPDEYRLKKRRDFSRAYSRGRSKSCPEFVLYRYHRQGQQTRIGFSASKKLGSAVMRNRLKRVFRHAAAESISSFDHGCDYIFVIRQAASKSTFEQIVAQIV